MINFKEVAKLLSKVVHYFAFHQKCMKFLVSHFLAITLSFLNYSHLSLNFISEENLHVLISHLRFFFSGSSHSHILPIAFKQALSMSRASSHILNFQLSYQIFISTKIVFCPIIFQRVFF